MTLADLERETANAERKWCAFLNSLTPWERHFLFGNELELHDLYMHDDLTFEGIREYASQHFAEVNYKEGVVA